MSNESTIEKGKKKLPDVKDYQRPIYYRVVHRTYMNPAEHGTSKWNNELTLSEPEFTRSVGSGGLQASMKAFPVNILNLAHLSATEIDYHDLLSGAIRFSAVEELVFNFTLVRGWLSPEKINLLSAIMTASPYIKILTLDTDSSAEKPSSEEWEQNIIKLLVNLPKQVTTLKFSEKALPSGKITGAFEKHLGNLCEYEDHYKGKCYLVNVSEFRARKSFVALLMGLHSRVGARSILPTVASRSTFDKQVLRLVYRMAFGSRIPRKSPGFFDSAGSSSSSSTQSKKASSNTSFSPTF